MFEDSNEYLSALHDGFQKYLKGIDTLEIAHDSVQTLLHNNYPFLFPYGQMCTSVSGLAIQMLYPFCKVPQLHLHCSYCNHIINDNHVCRIMYVNCNATGPISQILDNHLHYRSQEIVMLLLIIQNISAFSVRHIKAVTYTPPQILTDSIRSLSRYCFCMRIVRQ